ncbi:MAG: hypothetical protein ABI885_24180 [Gammaproteobacteria bacterium]
MKSLSRLTPQYPFYSVATHASVPLPYRIARGLLDPMHAIAWMRLM